MIRKPVESRNITSVGYESSSGTLEVEFFNNDIYQFVGVPQEVYDEFMGSQSLGGYFHNKIKVTGYAFKRL
ncbi:MAG: KTSC domain-containing protein [Thermodesulfobacteriota bacterium]